MEGHSRKWMVLAATIWIQAFTGTNFDFSSYSSTLKTVLGISQVQLNYLAMASDLGKAFGWCSGLSLLHFPLWIVLFLAAFMGLFAYALQWLVISNIISLPYFLVFLLCLTAGCSICWFNTVCYVICIKNFPGNRALALSLTISFNGLSAALYSLIVNTINTQNDTLYLLLNAVVPLFVSCLALLPILSPFPLHRFTTDASLHDDSIFLILNILAFLTGLYLLLLQPLSSISSRARILLGGAVLLLFFPLCVPAILYARSRTKHPINSSSHSRLTRYNLVDSNDLELVKDLIRSEGVSSTNGNLMIEKEGCSSCFFGKVIGMHRLSMLAEEHTVRMLVRRWDFWLYYITYFCGGTIGIVYSNNLGQIAQSLGYYKDLSSLITLYSSCSFFGRLLSAAPDFLRDKVYFARTGWLAVATMPMPIAFSLIVATGSKEALQACTALVGLSSGFIFAAAVSITSELFGPNSTGVNHNILITNIPIGSFLYGLLAAVVYDSKAGSSSLLETLVGKAMVCMGRQCYLLTFIAWSCISTVGLISSSLLFMRTKPAYDHFERSRTRTQSSC